MAQSDQLCVTTGTVPGLGAQEDMVHLVLQFKKQKGHHASGRVTSHPREKVHGGDTQKGPTVAIKTVTSRYFCFQGYQRDVGHLEAMERFMQIRKGNTLIG